MAAAIAEGRKGAIAVDGFGETGLVLNHNAHRGRARDRNPVGRLRCGGLWRGFGSASRKDKKRKQGEARHGKPFGVGKSQPRSRQRGFPAGNLGAHLIGRGSAVRLP